MRLTIEQIRTLILIAAALLLALLGGLLFFAHNHHFKLTDLPGKLDGSVERSANGFTFSPSRGNHTLFTLHAEHVTQLKQANRSLLSKVSIIFYGKDGSREDRLAGDQFDYDPGSGEAKALGPVSIDLGAKDSKAEDRIHVKANGVSFNQKSGLVTTDKAVDFAFHEAAGSSVGAVYDSNESRLILNRSVEIHGTEKDRPYQLHAVHAELDRANRIGRWQQVCLELAQGKLSTALAEIRVRESGSIEELKAHGGLLFEGNDGNRLQGSDGEVSVSEQNRPEHAHIGGGLTYTQQTPAQQASGNASDGWFDFTPAGDLAHAHLAENVSYSSHSMGAGKAKPRNNARQTAGTVTDRAIHARELDINFVQDRARHTRPSTMLAQGSASAKSTDQQPHQAAESFQVEGNKLSANFDSAGELHTLDGEGATRLTELARDGSSQISSGQTLHVDFAPEASQRSRMGIEHAVQQGTVTILAQPSPKAKDQGTTHATAARADYDGGHQQLELTGAPRIVSGGLDLAARVVDLYRTTGDALATGNVQATYLSSAQGQAALGGREPAHVIADSAQMTRKTGETIFRGNARLWQGQNAIAAPAITMQREEQSLHAEGSGAQLVHASLLMAGSEHNAPSVLRVTSHEFDYRDKQRKGVFSGRVLAETGYASATAAVCNVFLTDAKPTGKRAEQSGSAQVERMLVEGGVNLSAPGRRGAGARLDYHAATGEFVLSGGDGSLPTLEDATRGSVTGGALIFNTHDDSVRVESRGAPTVTDTTVPR